MRKRNDGGSAFPYHGPRNVNLGSGPLVLDTLAPGMSLRAWLAGQALKGLIINPQSVLACLEDGSPIVTISERACELADNLIAELEK